VNNWGKANLDFVQILMNIRKDKHLMIFAINCFLVVFGYFLGNIAPGIYPVLKAFKVVFLIYAATTQIVYHFNQDIGEYGLNMGWIYLYLFVLLGTVPFSFDPAESFSRYITYLGGILYLGLFSKYMAARYSMKESLIIFSTICLGSYIFPVLVAIVGLPILISVSFHIYGDSVIQSRIGFMSNNFGWAGSISFIAMYILLTTVRIEGRIRFLFIALMLYCIFLIMVSESRSSLLIMGICISMIVAGPSVKPSNKLLIVLAILAVILLNFKFGFVDLTNTRFNDKLLGDKSNLSNEFRVVVFENTKNYFYFHQEYYLHGFGWGVFVPAYQQMIDSSNDMDMHNTYLQLLYECGSLVFIIFVFIFFLPAIFKFLVYMNRYIIFLPFLILPYFENNLNSGQFVFFPFMFTLFFVSGYKRRQWGAN
jgi:hypothetical protein